MYVYVHAAVSGATPPPCARFTPTTIDNHRAVLLGGFQPRSVDKLFHVQARQQGKTAY